MASYIDAEEYLKRLCEVEYQMDRQSNKPITAMIAKNVFMLVRDELRGMPIADVQAFFTEDEIALINEYKDEVKAVDFKTAILNAVSVAIDRVDYEPTEDTHDRFNEFTNAQDALKPLLARFKKGIL